MVITLDAELEAAVKNAAEKQGETPESLVVTALRRRYLPFLPKDEWERQLLTIGIDAGVSLSDKALSSEGIYE